jgi:hypothetical protein
VGVSEVCQRGSQQWQMFQKMGLWKIYGRKKGEKTELWGRVLKEGQRQLHFPILLE